MKLAALIISANDINVVSRVHPLDLLAQDTKSCCLVAFVLASWFCWYSHKGSLFVAFALAFWFCWYSLACGIKGRWHIVSFNFISKKLITSSAKCFCINDSHALIKVKLNAWHAKKATAQSGCLNMEFMSFYTLSVESSKTRWIILLCQKETQIKKCNSMNNYFFCRQYFQNGKQLRRNNDFTWFI